MEEKTNELVDQLEAIPHWEDLGEQVISWDAAAKIALSQNLELRRGKLAIEDAERSVSRIFLDMIPGVNLDAMITEDVERLQNVSADDISYHTNIVFNFPSLTKVPLDYYTAKASVFRAKKNLLLKEREILSGLYKAAMEYDSAREAYRLQLETIAYNDDGREKHRIEEDWKMKSRQLSSSIAKTMGNIDKRWLINVKTMPRINWPRYKQASHKLDFLVMTMMALELEASRLGILGIKMQYFPELNVNFYSPSLFSSTAGTYSGVYADSGDMKINMNLSWKLDTQLRVWHQLKSAKKMHEFLVEEVKMRMIERREKIKALIKSRQDFEEWRNYMVKRIDFLTHREPSSVEDYKKNRSDIAEMVKEINSQELKNVEVEASLILEYGFL